MKRKSIILFITLRQGYPAKVLVWLLLAAFMNMMSGCFYYKVITSEDDPSSVIIAQQEVEKFFILHIDGKAWEFSDIHVKYMEQFFRAGSMTCGATITLKPPARIR